MALGVLGLALRVRAYLWAGTLGFGLGVLRQGWLLITTYPAAAVGHGHPAGPASDLDGSQF
ncbi:hypothetical protein ACVW01_000934 [Thermostichus sp. MS-CIW-19]